jgi:hypothetical protein
MSTSVPIVGMSPCLPSLRRSASAALRYWVGLAPNLVKTRRQAAIEGMSAIAVPFNLSDAARCSAR